MKLRLVYGEDMQEKDLLKVWEIDKMVYTQGGYVGEISNIIARFLVDNRQYVCLEDEENHCMAGYISFFTCTRTLYENIRYESSKLRDDDITAEELTPWNQEKNYLYVDSLALNPNYKDTGAIKMLTEGWIDYLNEMERKGYPIEVMTATTVSADGAKAARRMCFEEERILQEDKNHIFVCEGDNLKRLLKKDLYL